MTTTSKTNHMRQRSAPGEPFIPRANIMISNLPFVRSGARHGELRERLGKPGQSFPGNSDASVFFQVYMLNLLADDARVGIIGPLAWLSAGYGIALQRHLVQHYSIEQVLSSRNIPWFGKAQVRALVLIMQKRSDRKEPIGDCRFISSFDPHKPRQGRHNKELSRRDTTTRVRIVSQSTLKHELTTASHPGVWNRYLRAPDVYFDILDRCRERMTRLGEIATIKAGLKSGINAFFYVRPVGHINRSTQPGKILIEAADGNRFYIESQFLAPVIISPAALRTVTPLRSDPLKHLAFVCDKDRDWLERNKCTGALEYLAWGESMTGKSGAPWPEVRSVRQRRNWWTLPQQEPCDVLLPMSTNRRLAVFQSPPGAIVDHNLFTCTFSRRSDRTAALCYMNSALFMLLREVHARAGLGGGAAKMELSDWKAMPVPRDFRHLPRRKPGWFRNQVEPVDRELERPEQREFDERVLRGLGLKSGEYLERIYSELLRLVDERASVPH